MLQAIFDQVREHMQQQIQERFGLSSDQTMQSTNILIDNFKRFVSEDVLSHNMENVKTMMASGIQQVKENPAFIQVQENVLNELVNKVGLSPEKAQQLRDFQVTELVGALQSEFLDADGRPDINKILSKVNVQEIQEKAKEMLGGLDLGKFFGK